MGTELGISFDVFSAPFATAAVTPALSPLSGILNIHFNLESII